MTRPAHRTRTRARALALAAASILTAACLAGCAGIPAAPAWAPRTAAPAALGISDAGPTAAQPDAPSGTPAGLDVRLLYNDDPASPVGARWGEIPGNQPFTDLLRGRVTTAIAEHAAATGTPYEPAADAPGIAPEARGCVPGSSTRAAADLLTDPAFTPPGDGPTLTITCEIVAAAGTVLVEALRITTADAGKVTSDTTTVYYADTSGAFVTTSDTLISDDGLRTLLRLVVQSLKVRAGALQPEMMQSVDEFPVEQLRALFAHFSFAPDGSLVVNLPADFSTPELDRLATTGGVRTAPLFVTVPADTTTGLLTEPGVRVQSVLASGAPLTLPAAPWRGTENVDCALFACVAVTFDDGPGDHTAEVLDALDARRAAATFFLQGVNVGRHADVVARMQAEGHEIGNHTWNHPDLTKLPDPEIADQLARTSQAIQDAAGQRPSTFRPPYGAVDPRVLAQTDLPAILWTVDTNDWQLPDDETLLDRAVEQPKPGAIVLLHDVHENTARMTPAILDGLLGRGFTLVTVQQVLGGRLPAAHTTTSHG
ncbi:polysaccharide deacetylase family protein [Herbiconiux ginsengi]|uniref:Peptidoglycan/xylan/chitin deacetylase, PgdA/CDA1 family n=1 Tax=Herbiconiux ginsengi TaxID=381665 RepID=A0A1H3QLY4_9MICO|nr:polysaccharide deacetylase family protein [Herbiconiux ginsengi]SDZ14552.1 Peptidoglycan/xylan/chitin deacetylase, PgdA/CDA1 family [Herbiconiux ginsengi]